MKPVTQPAQINSFKVPELRTSFGLFRTIFLAILCLQILFLAVQGIRWLPVTGDNMYPESAGVVSAYTWAHGMPLYQDYRNPPYLTAAFTPLWYLLLGVTAKLGISDLNSLVLFGRFLSVLCVVAIAGLAYLWNRRVGISPHNAVFAPAFFLSFPILIPWAVTARPDFPALLPSFLAILIVGNRDDSKSIALASVSSTVSFLMRHNSVVSPVAIVLWLLWRRKWKQALYFSIVWWVLVGFVLGFYQWQSHGMFFTNIGGAKFGAFAVTYIRDLVANLLTTGGNAFGLSVFGFGVFAIIQVLKESDPRHYLITIYIAASLFFAILGSAAAGAGGNHFLEASLAMAVLAPLGIANLEKTWNSTAAASMLLIVLLLAFLLPSVDLQRSKASHSHPEDLSNVLQLVSSKHVFSDIPYIAARSSPPELIDMASLINTERFGGKAAWTSSQLVQDLETKKYELAVLLMPIEKSIVPNQNDYYPRTPRINRSIQAAIQQNYQFCFELDSSFVYAPIPADSNFKSNCPVMDAIHR